MGLAPERPGTVFHPSYWDLSGPAESGTIRCIVGKVTKLIFNKEDSPIFENAPSP